MVNEIGCPLCYGLMGNCHEGGLSPPHHNVMQLTKARKVVSFFSKAVIRERGRPGSFISTVPVLQHTTITEFTCQAQFRSNPIETPGTIDLHWISWTSHQCLGHLLSCCGCPRRHKCNFGRLECSALVVAELHVLELPHLPVVFVPLLE